MEIPYIVNARKDTGLFNSKIAIWLFLASEVMLFGGFFSAYVFLRLGADYPWPERTLPVMPGLINTFVLIGSSVTVVFAWAALKMREWRKFQIYMGITIVCALLFMVLKGIEYNVKFKHQAVRLTDYSVVEGHLGYEKDADGKYEEDHHGDHIEENVINVETEKMTFNLVRYHASWVDEILNQAEHKGAKLTLSDDVTAVVAEGEKPVVLAEKGTPLSLGLLKAIKRVHLAARSHNSELRTGALRQEWVVAKKDNPTKQGWELANDVNIDMDALGPRLLSEIGTVAFDVNPPVEIRFHPRDISEGTAQSRLRDDTVINGNQLDSPMVFHNADAIDFQHLVMKAEEKGISPESAIQNSWLMGNNEFVREAWEWHLAKMNLLRQRLIDDYGLDEDGNPKREPTHKELYRLGWKELAAKGVEHHEKDISTADKLKEEFMGPNYEARGEETFPEIIIPRENILNAEKFSPAWNTYYAIYFTITGLHGLHVIGGALVLAYYLFFGRKMYLENPEWLANRVEVGGLFWHFVDLVWIFVFPVLYLM